MKKYWKKIILLVTAAILAGFLIITAGELVSFEMLKRNSTALADYVMNNYAVSLLAFALVFLSTAFFVPGALVLTVGGGFLFGAVSGALYASILSTAGSTLAFLLSRHVISGRIQTRYRTHLERFNREIARYGPNYVFVLRIIPIMPSFLINYLAGITPISTVRFALATFLGIFPGASVYSFAGRQLKNISAPKDILSANVMIGFSVLALFALMPVLYSHLQRWTHRKKQFNRG